MTLNEGRRQTVGANLLCAELPLGDRIYTGPAVESDCGLLVLTATRNAGSEIYRPATQHIPSRFGQRWNRRDFYLEPAVVDPMQLTHGRNLAPGLGSLRIPRP